MDTRSPPVIRRSRRIADRTHFARLMACGDLILVILFFGLFAGRWLFQSAATDAKFFWR